MPASQVNGPFSVRKPLSELQPGPPFSQITTSSGVLAWVEGKNQKKSLRVSAGSSEMGSRPAYDSPTSKGTSGMPVPFTENGSVLFVAKKLVARFWISGCLKGSFATRLSRTGFALLNALSFSGEFPARVVEAQSTVLKSERSFILTRRHNHSILKFHIMDCALNSGI